MQRVIDSYKGSDRKPFGIWIERSYDLFIADRAKESLHFLKAAFKDDPANHELGLLLAEVHFQEKEYAKAKECVVQVLEAHPDHIEAIFLMRFIQQRRGHLQETITTMEMVVVVMKNSTAGRALLGVLLPVG